MFPDYLGLESAFSKSNGVRDKVINCEIAEKVLKMLHDWFNDYNHMAPHSALGMMSPVGYKLPKSR
jgi:putative transposase